MLDSPIKEHEGVVLPEKGLADCFQCGQTDTCEVQLDSFEAGLVDEVGSEKTQCRLSGWEVFFIP